MNAKKNALLAAVGLALACGAVTSASADTTWKNSHPRRVAVNSQLKGQDQRIRQAHREGEISARKAHRLLVADRHIRRQERRLARHHGGHITAAEQHRLSREETKVSRKISS